MNGFILLKKNSDISTHIMLYRKAKNEMPPVTISEKDIDTAGPRIGKRRK